MFAKSVLGLAARQSGGKSVPGFFGAALKKSSPLSTSSLNPSSKSSLTSTSSSNAFRFLTKGNSRSFYTTQRSLSSSKTSSTTSSLLLGLTAGAGAVLLSTAYLYSQGTNVIEAENFSDDINTPAKELPVYKVPLVFAPNVPPPITRKHRAILKLEMSSSVVTAKIHGDYKYEFWTFDGAVPGPFIRARVGDVLDVSLLNKDESGMMHNIDFHAVTGPGGGAALLGAESNERVEASFKLLQPGLYIYHCAVGPVPVHVANGMYGLILVEPKEGLPKVDKEFYVFQSEFYYEIHKLQQQKKKGRFGLLHGHSSKVLSPEEQKAQEDYLATVDFSFEDGMDENPKSVVFNGHDGALRGEGALQVNQGERVRIYFGNGGPNLISNFHIIGTIFDKVYREGDLISPPARAVQTTLVPAGGATVVEFDALVPGNYTIVDHALFRLEKGAVGWINVKGEPRPDIYAPGPTPGKNCPNCNLHP